MKTKNILCIVEWQSFGIDDIQKCLDSENSQSCDKKAQKFFNDLKDFACSDEKNYRFLTYTKRGDKEYLKARNFVGLIQTKSGFCVEILPKTFASQKDEQGFESQKDERIKSAKNILIQMLKTLKESPFQKSEISSLNAQNMPLFEIFVLMFLSELESLVKRGLKSDYVAISKNRNFLKGKLLFNENVKQNFAHKERFFTSSDEFTPNNAQNRLIKSTIELLSTKSLSAKTSTKLDQMRFIFADIVKSGNLRADFAICQTKSFRDYEMILKWCEIFLLQKAFVPYSGKDKAHALLFDMNKLFESFVAHKLRNPKTKTEFEFRDKICEQIKEKDFYIKTQEKSKFLAKHNGKNIFNLRPDIVGYADSETKFIADTKWKILTNDKTKNYEISQSDMYQLFAYLAKYKCENGFLIYPQIQYNEKIEFIIKNQNKKIIILFFIILTV